MLTELGATDRCCISFGVSCVGLDNVADALSRIYSNLQESVLALAHQDLQRVIPLFWSFQHQQVPNFFNFSSTAFLDIRSSTQDDRWRIQATLIDMSIPYYIQKRSILVIYAVGVQLENFRSRRLRIFQEQIILPFGKEEGSFQCTFTPSVSKDTWTVDFQPIGSDRYEA